MAYSATNLTSARRLKNNLTLWSYVSSDSLATIAGAGYFNGASTLMRVGDSIVVVGNATPGLYTVSANSGGVVTVVGISAGGSSQPLDDELTAIAGLTSAADKGIQFTGAGTAGTYDLTAAGKALLDDADAAAQRQTLQIRDGALNVVIDGAGSTITTGIKLDTVVPFDCVVTGWWALADQTGSIVIDIWKDSYANFPPTNVDTITGTEKPTISGAIKGQDTSLSTWTTSLSKGDILRFNVDSVTSIQRLALYLSITR